MASAEVPDHRSVNLLKFCELAPGVYEGSQGVDLRDFIELYHSDLKLSHFGVVPPSSRSSGRFTNKKTRSWFKPLTRGNGSGLAQNLSDTYTLSEEGVVAVQSGFGAIQVYSMTLRCQGGIFRGDSNGSGANCQKVPWKEGWCSSMGHDGCPSHCALSREKLTHSAACSRGLTGSRVAKCDDKACPFVKDEKARLGELIFHGCALGVLIEATLDQMARGLRTVTISGQHVAHGTDWVSATKARLGGQARDVLVGMASIAPRSGRASVLETVTQSARSYVSSGGVGEGALAGEVASIKLPSYKQMSRSLEHLQRTGG